MSDEALRRLEREATDEASRYRFRVECVRAGRLDLAGIEVGDKVLSDHVQPREMWVHELRQVKLSPGPSGREREFSWAVLSHHPPARVTNLSGGLLVNVEDVTLVEPGRPGPPREKWRPSPPELALLESAERLLEDRREWDAERSREKTRANVTRRPPRRVK